MDVTDALLSLALGVALAAAVGLRVFLPLLIVALAAHFGHLPLAAAFDWLAGWPAIVMLGVAATAEMAAYYIPGVDNLLDALAAPLALVAGTFMVAAPLWELPPLIKWTAAIVAGGGAAGLTQGVTSMLRAKSTLTTAGVANPVVATGELGGALLLSLLALAVPLLALIIAIIGLVLLYRFLRKLLRAAANSGAAAV